MSAPPVRTRTGTVFIGKFDWGGLLPIVKEPPWYPRHGRNRQTRAKSTRRLTARRMSRVRDEIGVVSGRSIMECHSLKDKGTPGIRLISPSVHAAGVWHLMSDIASGLEKVPGLAFRKKRHASGLDRVRQVGPICRGCGNVRSVSRITFIIPGDFQRLARGAMAHAIVGR